MDSLDQAPRRRCRRLDRERPFRCSTCSPKLRLSEGVLRHDRNHCFHPESSGAGIGHAIQHDLSGDTRYRLRRLSPLPWLSLSDSPRKPSEYHRHPSSNPPIRLQSSPGHCIDPGSPLRAAVRTARGGHAVSVAVQGEERKFVKRPAEPGRPTGECPMSRQGLQTRGVVVTEGNLPLRSESLRKAPASSHGVSRLDPGRHGPAR
jgi:hypothetical protein